MTLSTRCRTPIAASSWKRVVAVLTIILTTVSALAEKTEGHKPTQQKQPHRVDRTITSTSFDIPPFAVDLSLHYRNQKEEFVLDHAFTKALTDVTEEYLEDYADYMTDHEKISTYIVQSIDLSAHVQVLPDRLRKVRRLRSVMEKSSDSVCLRATFDGSISFKDFRSSLGDEAAHAIDIKSVRGLISRAFVRNKKTASRYVIAIQNAPNEYLANVENVLVRTDLDLVPLEETTETSVQDNLGDNAINYESSSSNSYGSIAVIVGIVAAFLFIICVPYAYVQRKKKQATHRREMEYLERQNTKKTLQSSKPDVYQDDFSSIKSSIGSSSRRSGSGRHILFGFNRDDDQSEHTASSLGLDSTRTIRSKAAVSSRSLRSDGSKSSTDSRNSNCRIVKVYNGDGGEINDDFPALGSRGSGDNDIEGSRWHSSGEMDKVNNNYKPPSSGSGHLRDKKKKKKTPRATRVTQVYDDDSEVAQTFGILPCESAAPPMPSRAARNQTKNGNIVRKKSSGASVSSRTTRSGGRSQMSSIKEVQEDEEEDESEDEEIKEFAKNLDRTVYNIISARNINVSDAES